MELVATRVTSVPSGTSKVGFSLESTSQVSVTDVSGVVVAVVDGAGSVLGEGAAVAGAACVEGVDAVGSGAGTLFEDEQATSRARGARATETKAGRRLMPISRSEHPSGSHPKTANFAHSVAQVLSGDYYRYRVGEFGG
jgi:hypothetical protein